MRLNSRNWWRLVPALLWMGLIFFMSHQRGGESGALSRVILEYLASWGLDLRAWFGDNAFLVIRKMAHFTEYFILFFFIDLALSIWYNWKQRRWLALGITALYAASDEFHQLFIAGRIGNIGDVFIDSLGALAALGSKELWRWVFRKK